MSAAFSIEQSGGVATLTLSRPGALNSFEWGFWRKFKRAVEDLDADGTCRALIIAAQGPHFSAGMDYAFFQCAELPEGVEDGRYREGLLRAIRHLQAAVTVLETVRFPVIAAVQGACIGGALDLICAAAIRICSKDARFQAAEVEVGLAPDLGTIQRLPRLISPAVATELILTGRPCFADEALRLGLVSALAPDAAATLAKAHELAAMIASRSPVAVAGIKANLLFSRDNTVASGLDQIAAWNAGMFVTEDIARSIAARRERSVPQYDDLQPIPPDWMFA